MALLGFLAVLTSDSLLVYHSSFEQGRNGVYLLGVIIFLNILDLQLVLLCHALSTKNTPVKHEVDAAIHLLSPGELGKVLLMVLGMVTLFSFPDEGLSKSAWYILLAFVVATILILFLLNVIGVI